MPADISQLNLIVAWLWVFLGIVSGALLGSFFQREDWLGGYASLKRRLYRLGHIAFFGTALLNLMFHLTVRDLTETGPGLVWASWAFVVGAVGMPVCCLIMAHRPALRLLFAVPVIGLAAGSILTLLEVIP